MNKDIHIEFVRLKKYTIEIHLKQFYIFLKFKNIIRIQGFD